MVLETSQIHIQMHIQNAFSEANRLHEAHIYITCTEQAQLGSNVVGRVCQLQALFR